MPRRGRVVRKDVTPDASNHSVIVAKLINNIMARGKKSIAERIVYDALRIMERRGQKDPVATLEKAVKDVTPVLEVKSRRVGGATYQVPVEVRPERGRALAMRWLIKSARARGGKSMAEKLAAELSDASKGEGATIKKRDDTHKMAEANRAFAHYRW
jgi:small subunit ribosomal protein S7